jgi:hypothetical protein
MTFQDWDPETQTNVTKTLVSAPINLVLGDPGDPLNPQLNDTNMLGVTLKFLPLSIPIFQQKDYVWYFLSILFLIFVLAMAFYCIYKSSHMSILPLDALNERMRDILDAQVLVDLVQNANQPTSKEI